MRRLLLCFWLLTVTDLLFGQGASVREDHLDITTYPFYDPNPVPILSERNRRIYPYHSFDGYSEKGVNKKWKVVTLENEYIKVQILPEIGGKIYSAIEKSTGKDFIYKNEVIKFRNVALRGPWTSGGIEFNFGTVGHAPSTATPVDYHLRKNEDGSVSCFLSNMDLTSRTIWCVEVRLTPDKAYFEMRSAWQNPTPIPQSYYQWMNAAAAVSEQLRFYYSGNVALEHNGMPDPWPVDSNGTDLSWYANNKFGSHKSWHIAGRMKSYMGGYYSDSQTGFGHWSRYDEMPGKKLWLWALSRNGGIWEDLLTDNDGQYMEFQSGRYLNQFLADPKYKSPITHPGFPPAATDTWTDIWFPIKGTGGMVDASMHGVLNVGKTEHGIKVSVNAFEKVDATLVVKSGEKEIHRQTLSLSPIEVRSIDIPSVNPADLTVSLEGMDLRYTSEVRDAIKRSFESPEAMDRESASFLALQGKDHLRNRDYRRAKETFETSIERDPHLVEALLGLSEIHYRGNHYDSALMFANHVLSLDTYHPAANYWAGLGYEATHDYINALESFGWSARSQEFRSAACSQMAIIFLKQDELQQAGHYAGEALKAGELNPRALKVLSIVYRKTGREKESIATCFKALAVNPLNHFFRYENLLAEGNIRIDSLFSAGITNEFPYQTYLEVSMDYYSQGQQKEAMDVLRSTPGHPLISLWKAYLTKGSPEECIDEPIAFVFPYRQEMEPVLQWAISKNPHWKFRYYLGLLYWSMDRGTDAAKLLEECRHEPDDATFYLSRAAFQRHRKPLQELADLRHALQLQKKDWRTWKLLLENIEANGTPADLLKYSTEAHRLFKNNAAIGLLHARSLMINKRYAACLNLLDKIAVLPFEGSTQGKVVYEQANLLLALDLIQQKRFREARKRIDQARLWPENLGVGQPYDPDNRIHDYLALQCTTDPAEIATLENSIVAYTAAHYETPSFQNLFGLMLMKKQGKAGEYENLLKKLESSDNKVDQWVTGKAKGQPGDFSSLEAGFQQNIYFELVSGIVK